MDCPKCYYTMIKGFDACPSCNHVFGDSNTSEFEPNNDYRGFDDDEEFDEYEDSDSCIDEDDEYLDNFEEYDSEMDM